MKMKGNTPGIYRGLRLIFTVVPKISVAPRLSDFNISMNGRERILLRARSIPMKI